MGEATFTKAEKSNTEDLDREIIRLTGTLNHTFEELYWLKLKEWKHKPQAQLMLEHCKKYCCSCKHLLPDVCDVFCEKYDFSMRKDRNLSSGDILKPIKDNYKIKENICSEFRPKYKEEENGEA